MLDFKVLPAAELQKKIRKDATKKISGLIESATKIVSRTAQSRMDDSYDYFKDVVNSSEVLESIQKGTEFYSDMIVWSYFEHGELVKVTIAEGSYHFCDKYTLTFEPVEAEPVTPETVEPVLEVVKPEIETNAALVALDADINELLIAFGFEAELVEPVLEVEQEETKEEVKEEVKKPVLTLVETPVSDSNDDLIIDTPLVGDSIEIPTGDDIERLNDGILDGLPSSYIEPEQETKEERVKRLLAELSETLGLDNTSTMIHLDYENDQIREINPTVKDKVYH